MVLTVDKIGSASKSTFNILNNSSVSQSVYKGKFKRPLTKPLSLWTSLFSNGLNACTIDAERQNWNAPRFGVGMFHVKAMMIGNELFLINSNYSDSNDGNLERLVLELSVKYNITPDKKVAKSNWNWNGMTPYIKDSPDYLSLMDEFQSSNLDSYLNTKQGNLKCKKLSMHFDYAPELLRSKDSPNGIRQSITKNKLNENVSNIISYVLKQYFSNITIEEDDYMHTTISNIISKGVNNSDLMLFNGGIISPWEAICLLDQTYALNNTKTNPMLN